MLSEAKKRYFVESASLEPKVDLKQQQIFNKNKFFLCSQRVNSHHYDVG